MRSYGDLLEGAGTCFLDHVLLYLNEVVQVQGRDMTIS